VHVLKLRTLLARVLENGVQVVQHDDQKRVPVRKTNRIDWEALGGGLVYFDGFSIEFSSIRVGARRRQAKVLPVATSRRRLPCTQDR